MIQSRRKRIARPTGGILKTAKKRRQEYTRKDRLWRSVKSPVPTKFATKVIYASQFQLDAGVAGVPGVYVFSANGLFDPDITGVGHQPRGFDQIMALYDHYVVIAVKVKFEMAPASSTASNVARCGITLKDSSTVFTNANNYMEAGYTIWSLASVGGTSEGVKFEKAYNPNKFLGRSKPLADAELKGSASANPTEQAFLHLWTAPVQSLDAGPFDCQVHLEYSVVFIEPKIPGQS